MDSNENEGYYFYAREKKSKSAGSKRNNRVIRVNKQAFWKMNFSDDVWEEGLLWGKKNTLNYFSGPNVKTDWLMYEFVFDPSLAEGNDGNIVLCKVYKKKDSKEEKLRRRQEGSNVKGKGKSCLQGSSQKIREIVPLHDINSGQPLKRRRMNACFPQLNQKIQFAVGPSSSVATPYIQETHPSEVARQPSFSTESSIEGIHPAEVAASSTTNHCVDAAPVDDPKLYFQPPAAFGSANPYIQKTHSEAVIQLSFSTEPYIDGIHPAEVAASGTTNHCVDTAPVDDPKPHYQPPAAFGSATPYIQETHPADTAPCTINHSSPAEPCTIAASSSSSIAPTDDLNVYCGTDPEWEQEIQQYLMSFEPIDQLNDSDDFDEKYFASIFNM